MFFWYLVFDFKFNYILNVTLDIYKVFKHIIYIFKQACDKSKQLQTHITGVLVHGITTNAFVDINQWPHDSNLTLNCLLYTLCQEANKRILPKTLYIQLDNCARENKNKYFMGLMALMVLKGYFHEVS